MPDFIITCSGAVTENNAGRPACDTGWNIIEYVAPLNVSELDPITVASFVGAGFFMLLPLWVAMLGGRAIIKSINF